MFKFKNIGIALVAGMLVSACGNDQTSSDENPEVGKQEKIVDPIDSIQKKAETEKWYAGDASTDAEKQQLMLDFRSGEKDFDFYAVFTEPFWHFYFFGNQVLIFTFESEIPEVVPLEYPFSDKEEEQALSFMLDGQFWQFKIRKEEGSDGMSEIVYPYSVKLNELEGGGATEMMRGE